MTHTEVVEIITPEVIRATKAINEIVKTGIFILGHKIPVDASVAGSLFEELLRTLLGGDKFDELAGDIIFRSIPIECKRVAKNAKIRGNANCVGRLFVIAHTSDNIAEFVEFGTYSKISAKNRLSGFSRVGKRISID